MRTALIDLETEKGITDRAYLLCCAWMAPGLIATALASAAGIEMSSHIFPEVCAHQFAATPACHWLEYVDPAAPVLVEPPRIVDDMAQVPDRPGSGAAWDTEAVKHYRIA